MRETNIDTRNKEILLACRKQGATWPILERFRKTEKEVDFIGTHCVPSRLQKFQAEMQSVMLVTDLETKNIRLGSLVAARYPDGDPTEDITITEDDYINPKGHLEKNE